MPETDETARSRRAEERAAQSHGAPSIRSWRRTLSRCARGEPDRGSRPRSLASTRCAVVSRRRRMVGSCARRPILLHARGLPRRGDASPRGTSSPATSFRPTCRSASRRRCAESPWDLYRRMRIRNAAPFAAFFETPDVVRRQRLARAFPARGRTRARRDAADQGNDARAVSVPSTTARWDRRCRRARRTAPRT